MPYVTRFVIQLPLFLAGQVVLLGVYSGLRPLLIAALTVIGIMLSKGKTPMEGSPLGKRRDQTA